MELREEPPSERGLEVVRTPLAPEDILPVRSLVAVRREELPSVEEPGRLLAEQLVLLLSLPFFPVPVGELLAVAQREELQEAPLLGDRPAPEDNPEVP